MTFSYLTQLESRKKSTGSKAEMNHYALDIKFTKMKKSKVIYWTKKITELINIKKSITKYEKVSNNS